MSTSESTAVATRQPTGMVSPAREEARLNYQQAQQIALSTVIPKEFQGRPENVLIAIQFAKRLGCDPLAVMQNLDVIHGRPSLRATFLIGTVNASGRFSPIRYRWEGQPGSDEWGCRAVAKDVIDGEECVGPLITIALAKKEGWYAKTGSKWQTIPELMLTYRAAAWWTRIYCPELSLGLHTSDEAEDAGPPRLSPQDHAERVAAALRSVDAAPQDDRPDFETVPTDEAGEPALFGEDVR